MAGLQYSKAFSSRRFWNYFPLGIAYAALYMGRYSYIPAKEDVGGLMGNAGLGTMTAVGAIVYGVSFLFNGPLTDRMGGQKAMLISTAGSAVINLLMGLVLATGWTDDYVLKMAILYGVNMYFQSFASVAIVKVNSNWFHINERGFFGGIFGILISSGLFLAYTVSPLIMSWLFAGQPQYYFFVPSIFLLVMLVVTYLIIRDTPEQAGHPGFSTGTDSEFDSAEKIPVLKILVKIVTHPIVLTIAFIELCTGVLRDGMIHWFGAYANSHAGSEARGMLGVGLFIAGATGAMLAGWVSDRFFNARRPPVAALFYSVIVTALIAASLLMHFLPDTPAKTYILFAVLIIVSFGVIGTHGVLSGAATADFGGKQATATAVGIIDGFVFVGVAIQGMSLGYITSQPGGWNYWFPFLIPFALIGLALSWRIRKVKPKMKAGH
jgi:OPA family glycerol-3-phosphate transporter-like MFS transporter